MEQRLLLCVLGILCMGYFGTIVGQKAKADSTVYAHDAILSNMFDKYNKMAIPVVNSTHPVNVDLGMRVIRVIDVMENFEVLELFVYMEHMWKDIRLGWASRDYPDIHTISVPADKLWLPDITVYNNIDADVHVMNNQAIIFADGSVLYSPKVRLRTHCMLDMLKFPYDQQTCTIIMGSYVYDNSRINLTSRMGLRKADTEFAPNMEWPITEMTSELFTRSYECCPEGYPQARFQFTLTRHSTYYSHVFVLPGIVLGILVPFQFLLPPECKERLTLGSTLLLGILVIIAMIQSYLPNAHPNLPYIVVYYCLTFVVLAISLVCSMFVMNIQSQVGRGRRMPNFIRLLFLKTLRKLVCLGDGEYFHLPEVEAVSMRSLEKQFLANSDTIKPELNKLEKDVEDILRHLSVLITMTSQSRVDMRSEWYQVALVFDRIMCFLFTLVFLIGTCVLFG